MHYSEQIVPIEPHEKKKQIITLVVICLLPFVFAGVGYLLRSWDFIWAVFCWVAAGLNVAFLLIPHLVRSARNDFFSHKVIYKGIVQEVRSIKVGAGTASTELNELVLEKKTLRLSEKAVDWRKLDEVPLPVQGEEVEIHALPKSGDIIKLLVRRNGDWKKVELV